MSDSKYSVVIVRFPGNGWERHELTTWLMQTACKMKADPRISESGTKVYPGGTPITQVRNQAVKHCLAEGFDYILMVDSDMVPDLGGEKPFWDTAWKFMLDRRDAERMFYLGVKDRADMGFPDRPGDKNLYAPATIAAPYCGPPPDENVYIFRWASYETDNPNPDHRLAQFSREEAATRGGIEEVGALPTGIILYDARLFRSLPTPWFDYEYDEEMTEKNTTEDVYQTRNASLLGFPQYVAWDCWAGHSKGKTVTRPKVVCADQVRGSFRRAIERGISSDERVQVVGRPVRIGDEAGVAVPEAGARADTDPDHAAIGPRR